MKEALSLALALLMTLSAACAETAPAAQPLYEVAHCTSAKALPRKKWTVFLYIYFISSTCSMCPVSRSSESVIAASCKFSPLMRTVRLPPDTATSSVL